MKIQYSKTDDLICVHIIHAPAAALGGDSNWLLDGASHRGIDPDEVGDWTVNLVIEKKI